MRVPSSAWRLNELNEIELPLVGRMVWLPLKLLLCDSGLVEIPESVSRDDDIFESRSTGACFTLAAEVKTKYNIKLAITNVAEKEKVILKIGHTINSKRVKTK